MKIEVYLKIKAIYSVFAVLNMYGAFSMGRENNSLEKVFIHFYILQYT